MCPRHRLIQAVLLAPACLPACPPAVGYVDERAWLLKRRGAVQGPFTGPEMRAFLEDETFFDIETLASPPAVSGPCFHAPMLCTYCLALVVS
jgi:hypothetical protein